MSTTTTETTTTIAERGESTTYDTATGDILQTWMKSRDKYGRTNYTLNRWDDAPRRGAVGVVVRLPKAAVEHYHRGTPYLVNAWGRGDDGRGLVTYARTLAEAKARLEAQTAA